MYADAHPGNFLFTARWPAGDFAILDVLSSRRRIFSTIISVCLMCTWRDDAYGMREVYQNLEMIDPNPTDTAFEERFFCILPWLWQPFFIAFTRRKPLISATLPMSGLSASMRVKLRKFTEPRGSRHFIYVSRLHVGLYRMLMKLGAVVATPEAKETLEGYIAKISSEGLELAET